MFNKVKLILGAISAFVMTVSAFILGGRLNQVRHGRKQDNTMKEIMKK
jgi:hypothetical protein